MPQKQRTTSHVARYVRSKGRRCPMDHQRYPNMIVSRAAVVATPARKNSIMRTVRCNSISSGSVRFSRSSRCLWSHSAKAPERYIRKQMTPRRGGQIDGYLLCLATYQDFFRKLCWIYELLWNVKDVILTRSWHLLKIIATFLLKIFNPKLDKSITLRERTTSNGWKVPLILHKS